MKIVLVGYGNVATILGERMKSAGHEIIQVIGRDEARARQLAQQLGAEGSANWKELKGKMDLYLVAIADRALPDLAGLMQLQDELVVHTAGAVEGNVLAPISSSYGVFYPLQSLRDHQPKTRSIPVLLEANTGEGLALLQQLARSMDSPYQMADGEQRLRMHLSAVWVNNFSNYLFSVAYQLCRENYLEFSLLQPLIQETIARIDSGDPFRFQTGPAMRGDAPTMEKHLALMEGHPQWQELYRQLSGLIREAVDTSKPV
ncbi:DUF2520 domain-containing protein [Flavihumibacter rivuli]|uniref:Rossmann-like and DUF2520 domain-containing protein n=1 Tax=Flavihumibacter rivuli TaxID=2838156 RepID=UPI001BDDE3F9|nr:Rossmann-like and DUF2520 domain-containing protein [Flavihumibacter rivuli]ULQ57563.1 DUF2520 domain-containing protein [Flavihumibacter rivuli]